jgi:2-iminobutanoate/2-iminopropanoate deaminase
MAAALPYSPSVKAGDYLIVSGQIGLVNGEMADGLTAQVRAALANLDRVLRSGSASVTDVVKTTVFLSHMDDFAAMNALYEEYFQAPYPARSTVAVSGLPRGALFEIEAWAYLGSQGD